MVGARLSYLRAPGRFSYLLVFACACLAAFGLQVLLARRARIVIALVGAVPMVGLLAGLLALFPPWRSWLAADPLRARDYVQSTYLSARAQLPIDPGVVVQGILASLDLTNPKTLWTLILLALSAIVFIVWLELGARRAAIGQSILVGLIAVDLLVFASDFHPKTPLASLVPSLPAGVTTGQRALLHEATDLPDFEPNQLLGAGVSAVEGYSSLPSQRHVELYAETAQQPRLFDLWAEQVVLVPTNPSDAHAVDGVPFRADHPLLAGFGGAAPSSLRVPPEVGPIAAVRLIGTLGYAYDVPQGTPIAGLTLGNTTLPIRAGVELSERAFDRPSLGGLLAHQKARTAFDFEEATPEGEAYTAHLYEADLPLDAPVSPNASRSRRSIRRCSSSSTASACSIPPVRRTARPGRHRIAAPPERNRAGQRPRFAACLPAAKSTGVSPARHPTLTATQLVASPDMDVHRQLLIENDPTTPAQPGPPEVEATPARLVDVGPNAVQVIASLDVPSYLVVADFYHRGWTAYVDGRPSRVFIADALFRAVALKPGQHVVEFRFEPLSHLLGALVVSKRWRYFLA